MIIAFDYYRTITSDYKIFKKLMQAIITAGYPVYIVTAVRRENISKVRESIKKHKVPYTHVEIVVFENFEDIPQLKLEAYKRLGVKFVFDDLIEVVEVAAKAGLLTALIR